MPSFTLSGLLTRLENARALDAVAAPVRAVVQRMLARRTLADALHGVWLGHPLHPLLAQTALGSFVSASVLDALPGPRVSSRVLIATGIGAAVPAVVTGYADWAMGHEQQQRVGLVHSATNAVGVGLYAGSLLAGRSKGRRLSFAGMAVISLGGFLGGHLSYRQAQGANHTEEVPHLIDPGWHDLGAVADLAPEGVPQRRQLQTADLVPLLVVRDRGEVRVLADHCAHMSAPLHTGEVADGCVTCPWHGSVFSLSDGSVVHGPATAPQPSFQTRVLDGRLQVCLPNAG